MNPAVAEEMLGDKVRSVFYTNPNRLNDNTGQPWEPTGSARIWRSSADRTFVGEDGQTSVDAMTAHAKRNTIVMTLKFDGIVCGESTINSRWTIIKGMIINRGIQYETPVPSYYAQYATAGPKPINNDAGMGDDTMPDTFGGIPLDASTTIGNA